jgi:hypothetical protein
VKLTVAICTWNRCALLDATLAALGRATRPPGLAWEVLVVDNGCTDATDQVVAAHSAHLPVRLVREPRAGLSFARNAAVAAATGDYVLWTDDDVLVEPGWLAAYHEAAMRWPAAAFFGGAIAPHFEGEPPAWLLAALPQVANAYSLLDLGDEPRPCDGRWLPYGANFAVRADAQRRHAFDPALGRRRQEMLAGEEWAVLRRLVDEGESGWWVPDARVRHVIPTSRQTVRYLRAYYVGDGFSTARLRAAAPNRGPAKRRAARVRGSLQLLRWAAKHEARYRWHRLFGRPAVWGRHLQQASTAWGMLRFRGLWGG